MIRAAFQLSINLLGLARFTARRLLWTVPGLRKNVRPYVKLSLPAGLTLAGTSRGIGPIRFGGPRLGAWWSFDKLLNKIANDPWVEGVYYRIPNARFGLTEAQLIARRLDRLRAAGKRVVCYLEQGMVRDYILASAADTIVMAPPGRLYTFGLRLEMMFLPQALKKAGVNAQFVNLGRFKTAAHRFTRETATPSQLRMMGHLLHGMGDAVSQRIAGRRQISEDSARAIFDDAPLSARQARRRKLIDKMAYSDQIIDTLESETSCKRKIVMHTPAQYARAGTPDLEWKALVRPRATVAVMSLKGVIMHDGARPPARQVITPKPVYGHSNGWPVTTGSRRWLCT